MQILQVDLDNVKSYRQASIALAPGTNAICGHNGAGKSTLLEAIGFALFDFLDVKQDDFVREGEKTATVTVHIAGADGRAYQVARRCGGSSQYYVYDPELDQKLTDGKAETVTWLREFLGVEPATDLGVLFRDAVGVPQGLLTAAFLETPSRRKDIFNPLLRVDEYERVWDALREPRRRLEQHITGAEKDIAGLSAEVRGLPALQAQLAELTARIAQNTRRQSEVQATLADVAARKTHLEHLKNELDALERQVTQAEAALQTLSARQADAQAALERSEAAQAVVLETTEAHQAYLAAEARLATLEHERVARDSVQHEQQTCAHAQDLAQRELASLEQTLAEVAEAEADMADLAPQVETQSRLEASLNEAQRAVEQHKAAEQTLTREQQRLADMEARLATLHTQLETRATLEAEAQTAHTELEQHNARREALVTQLSTQQAEHKVLNAQVKQAIRQYADAQRDLERERQRMNELEIRQNEIQRGLDTLAEVETNIEAIRAELATLEEQELTHTVQLAANQAEQERLRGQTKVLAEAETPDCPVCGAPLSPEHREDLLQRNRLRLAELETTIAETQTAQQTTVQARSNKQKALRALEKNLQRLPRRADAEDAAAQIAAQQQTLAEREEVANTLQAEVAHLESRQAALRSALDETKPQLASVDAAREAAQRIARNLDTRLAVLPRPAEAEALVNEIDAQRQLVAESKQAATALIGAPDETARLQEELTTLGNPRRAYQRAADIAAQRETAESQQADVQAQLAKLATQRADLEKQLAAYADLDTRIENARDERAAHAPDHQRYLQHEREAAALPERQATLAAARDELKEATAHRDAQIAARDDVAAQYDSEAYANLVTQHGTLREELAALQASLQHQEAQQQTIQENIARLDTKQHELDAAQAERDELAEVQALLETLRQVLRDAGPKVTRALVDMVSLHADRLYAEIMESYRGQNPSTRLRWTEDYDIVLTSQGRDRTFQQLSGGEQMSAALAVRLALLREISTVDIAFFDEPTANLDRDRRANLARQVLNIQGFGQLFVISHDDTFEQDTDFVVRVEKVGGESRVVSLQE